MLSLLTSIRYKFFLFLCLFLSITLSAQNTIYVKQNTPAGNDGSSWANAYDDLQDALAAAGDGDKIWVAKGTYYPSTTDATVSFVIPDDIELYGGFIGEEGSDYDLANRNFLENETLLSGNNFSSIVIRNSFNNPIVDGFTITKAFEGTGWSISGDPTIKNCVFKDNVSTSNGGAVSNSTFSSPTFLNCSFINNSSKSNGGAIYSNRSNFKLINCIFKGNKGADGGAIHLFRGRPELVNCLFTLNTADLNGGAIYNHEASPIITNGTFSGNEATAEGGAIYASNSISSPQFINTIIWGNKDVEGASSIVGGSSTYSHSLVEGLTSKDGNNNIDGSTNPLFVNSTEGNLHLTECSPVINKGDITANSSDTDLDGNSRNFSIIDLGVFEYQGLAHTETIYVKADANGSNDGSSWTNAFTDFQDALLLTPECPIIKQIWVAKGTYSPSTTNENVSLVIPDGIKIYGGLVGNEPANKDLNTRDIKMNETKLSGYRFTATNVGETTIIDGFIISSINEETFLNSEGFQVWEGTGTTWKNDNARLTIKNCSFINNRGFIGAIHNLSSNPLIENCLFKGNYAHESGGAIHNSSSLPRLLNCIFVSNAAKKYGGAIDNYQSNAEVINCTFNSNHSGEGGFIVGETVSAGGGAINNHTSNPKIRNTIIWGNTETSGVNNFRRSILNRFGSTPEYANCILQDQDYNVNGSPQYTDIGGTLSLDPGFVNAPSNLRLVSCNSPAFDAGDATLFPNVATATDFAGTPRKLGENIDIGAYEYQGVSFTILYVKADATGNNTGTSWTNAFTDLQDALILASQCTNFKQIWVAKGTYYPTTSKDRTISFSISDGIEIYGGFVGNEPPTYNLSNRAIQNNETILSGDIGIQEDDSDNSSQIITAANVGVTTIIDGFTISDAINTAWKNTNASPIIKNCSFKANKNKTGSAGAILNINSNPVFENCSFISNEAKAGSGGAIGNSSSDPKLVNCLFTGNTASADGGAIDNYLSNPEIINCTFSKNVATNKGGAIKNFTGSPQIINTIIWGNTAANGNSITNQAGATPIYRYSLIEEVEAGPTINGKTINGNLDGSNPDNDPLFEGPDDFNLDPFSPAIGAGDNASFTNLESAKDLAGQNRKIGRNIDLGAYEFQKDPGILTATSVKDKDTYNDAYIDVHWKLLKNVCLSNGGLPFDNGVYIQLEDDNGTELFTQTITDLSEIGAVYDSSYHHFVGPDKTINYTLNVYQIGVGNKLCHLTEVGQTDVYRGFQSFTASDKTLEEASLKGIELKWTSNSALPDRFNIFRDDTIFVAAVDTLAMGSTYTFRDTFVENNPKSIINGQTHKYCIEIYSDQLNQSFSKRCEEEGSTPAISLTASVNLEDRINLEWDAEVTALADRMEVLVNGSITRKLSVNESFPYSLSGLSVIPGDTLSIGLRLLDSKGNILATDYDDGYIPPNGKISGYVTTKTGAFPIQGATLIASALVNGQTIIDSTLSDINGYYEIDSIFYNQQNTFTVSIKKGAGEMVKTFNPESKQITLSQLIPEGTLDFLQVESFPKGSTNLAIDDLKAQQIPGQSALEFDIAFNSDVFPTYLKIKRGTEELTTLEVNSDGQPFIYKDSTGIPKGDYTYEFTLFAIRADSLNEDTKDTTLVFPELPLSTNLKATSIEEEGYTVITWDENSTSLSGLKLFRITDTDSLQIASLDPMTTEFIDWKGFPGVNYTYKLIPYRTVGEIDYDAIPIRSDEALYPVLPPASSLKAMLGVDWISFTWKKEAKLNNEYNYTGFLIERSHADTILNSIVFKHFSTAFVDYTGAPNKAYTYTIYTVKQLADTLAKSEPIQIDATFLPMSAPTGLAAAAEALNQIALKWTAPENTSNLDGYGIFDKDDVLLSTTNITQTKDTIPANHAEAQKYKVKAFRYINGFPIYSTPAESDNVKPNLPGSPQNQLADIANFHASDNYINQVHLTWDYPEYVLAEFEIFREEMILDTIGVAERAYFDTTAIAGKEYKYIIRSFRKMDGKDYASRKVADRGRVLPSIQNISGIVSSSPNNRAVSGVKIFLKHNDYQLFTFTDTSGYYQFREVPLKRLGAVTLEVITFNSNNTQTLAYEEGITNYVRNFTQTYEPPIPDTLAAAAISSLDIYELDCETGVRLIWTTTNNNYDGFEVKRGPKSLGLVAKGMPMVFTDLSAEPAVIQPYTVRPYLENETGNKTSGNGYIGLTRIPPVFPVEGLYASASIASNEVTLFWNYPCQETTYYIIRRDEAYLGKVAHDENMTFRDTTGVQGMTYHYTVTAIKERKDGDHSSLPEEVIVTYPDIMPIMNLGVTEPVTSKIMSYINVDDENFPFALRDDYALNHTLLEWSYDSKHCNGFTIYRDEQELVTLPCDSTSFRDYTGHPTSNYTYAIRVNLEREGMPLKSDGDTASIIFPQLAMPYDFKGTRELTIGNIELEFIYDTEGFDGFNIYRSESLPVTTASKKIGTVTEYTPGAIIKFMDNTGNPEKYYYYGVSAFDVRSHYDKPEANITYESKLTTIGPFAYPKLPVVTSLKATTNLSNQINVSWEYSNDAPHTNFILFRKAASQSSAYSHLATLGRGERIYEDLINTKDPNALTYNYKIVAVSAKGTSELSAIAQGAIKVEDYYDTKMAIGGTVGEEFGYSIATDGDWLVAGAPGADNNKGAVYLYKFEDYEWVLKDKQQGRADSRYGSAVDISGKHVIVGGPGKKFADIWKIENDKLVYSVDLGDGIPSPHSSSIPTNLGNLVSISEDWAAFSSTSGNIVYLFKYNNNTLTFEWQTLITLFPDVKGIKGMDFHNEGFIVSCSDEINYHVIANFSPTEYVFNDNISYTWDPTYVVYPNQKPNFFTVNNGYILVHNSFGGFAYQILSNGSFSTPRTLSGPVTGPHLQPMAFNSNRAAVYGGDGFVILYDFKSASDSWDFINSYFPRHSGEVDFGWGVAVKDNQLIVSDPKWNGEQGRIDYYYNAALTNVSASAGGFSTKTRIQWVYEGDTDVLKEFKIYRDDLEIATAPVSATDVFDSDGAAGKKYAYRVEAILKNEEAVDSRAAIGWRKGSGEISGTVKTLQGNVPIGGVTITAEGEVDGEFYTYEGMTDEDGIFKFTGVYVGEEPVDYIITASYISNGEAHLFVDSEQTATLRPENAIASGLAFLDRTAYVVTGKVQRANSVCGLEGIQINLFSIIDNDNNNKLDTIPEIFTTNAEGNYNIVINPFQENLTKIRIEIPNKQLTGEDIVNDTTLFVFNEENVDTNFIEFTEFPVDFPIQTDTNFIDQLTYPVTIKVQDACEVPISDNPGDQFRVRVASTDGCYNKVWPTNEVGEIELDLPPLKYNLRVESVNNNTLKNQLVLDYLKFRPKVLDLLAVHKDRGINTVLIAKDSLELTKKFTYHRPPTISLVSSLETPCAEDNSFAVFRQGQDYKFQFTVTEEHDGANCPVKEGFLKITNPGALKTDSLHSIKPNGEIPAFSWTAATPNVVFPYKWTITVDYLDADTVFQGRFQQIIFIEGSAGIPGNDIVLDIDTFNQSKIPTFILRDPPGDGSFSTIAEGQTIQKSMTIAQTADKAVEGFLKSKLVVAGISAEFNSSTILGGINGEGNSFDYEVTTNREISTSAELTGEDADIIVGYGFAQQYGLSQKLVLNADGCTARNVQQTAYTPTRVTTEWVYTVGHIKNIIAAYKADIKKVNNGTKTIKKNGGTFVTVAELETDQENWESVLEYHRINTLPHYNLCTKKKMDNPNEEAYIDALNTEINVWQKEFCPLFGTTYDPIKRAYETTTVNNKDTILFDENKLWNQNLINTYNKFSTAIRNIEGLKEADLLEGGDLADWRFNESSLEEEGAYVDADYEASFGVEAKNFTFAGGTSQTFSVSGARASTTSYTNSFYLNTENEAAVGGEGEITLVAGSPFLSFSKGVLKGEASAGLKLKVDYNFTQDRSYTETKTVEMSYTLADNDPGDQYSVTVINGIASNHTPYFNLLGGRTSCPVEVGAIHRDKADIQWFDPEKGVSLGKDYTIPGLVPADEAAVAYLQITNLNPFGEARDVTVFLENSVNRYGAVVRLGSAFLGEDIIEDLEAKDPLILPVTLERGFFSYLHEDIQVSARHTCRDGTEPTLNGVSLGGDRDDVFLTASFRTPCSPVTIVTPDNNWILRKNNFDKDAEKLRIGVRDYDPSNEDLTHLRFEYRRLDSGEDWAKMPDPDKNNIPFEITGSELENYNKTIIGEKTFYYDWNIANLTLLDGDYEIRAVIRCENIGVETFSNIVSGRIDRTNPELFGTPQPADGFWTNGDEISVTFNKLLDCTLFDGITEDGGNGEATYALYNYRLGDNIPATFTCGGGERNGKLIVRPTFKDGESMSLYDGDTLELRLSNIADISGNISEIINWKFVVLTHPLYWNPKELSLEVYKGTQTSIDAQLFNITNLPVTGTLTNTGNTAWLSAPSSISVPNVGRTVSLGIDARTLPVGTYSETINLAVEGQSDKPLTINLKVVAEAPNWIVNHANFSENMTMVSNFKFDGAEPIADSLDIISVWLDNTIRGVANIDKISGFNVANLFISGDEATDKDKELEFRVWVANEGKEYDAFPAAPILFDANSQVGTHAAPELLVIDKNKDEARYIPFNKDWTWFSVNTTIENDSINYWLGDLSKATTGDVIYNGERFAQYNEGIGWINEGSDSLLTLNANEGYMIHLQNGPDTLRLTGANAPLEELRLKGTGWTWIGYPFRDSLALNDPAITVKNIVNEENNLENGDEIKTLKQDNTGVFARYLDGKWNGSLTHLRPYDAYKLKTTNGGDLNYLGSNGINEVNGIIGVEDSLQIITSFQSTTTPNPLDASTWNRAPLNYEHLLPVIGEVFFNGAVATSPNDKVAAFVGNDLRGLG